LKKILKGTVLLAGAMFINGCSGLEVKPQIEKETIRTTKEVLIPHDDNIKKAVAILIKKTKDLGTEVSSNSDNAARINDKLESVTQDIAEQKKQSLNMTKKIDDLEKEIKKAEALQAPCSCAESNNVRTKNVENTPSEYDAIIKDFAYEGDLK